MPKDESKVITLFTNSANLGHAQAYFTLAVMFEHGQGVKQDTDRALRFYKKVAQSARTSPSPIIA